MYACILYVCCMRRALGFLDIAFLACVICRVLVSEFCKGDVLSVIFERRLHWFGAGDRAHDLWRRSEMYSAERRPFYSEILSQMRPPRLQHLITAEQHSQGHGCKEKERERERVRDHKVWVVLKKLLEGEGKCLLKQKTLSLQKHKGPRLPGDRCACCDFFFFVFLAFCRLLCMNSTQRVAHKLTSTYSEREAVSAEPPLSNLLTLTFAVTEDSVWKHEQCNKLFTHFLCPNKQLFETIHLFSWLKVRPLYCSASAQFGSLSPILLRSTDDWMTGYKYIKINVVNFCS